MPVDLESLQRLTPEQVRELRCWSSTAGRETRGHQRTERKNLTRDIQNEMLGFGPLEAAAGRPTVSDILVNTYRQSTSSGAASWN
jgi:pilus assembly protein CpaF